jgi:hypothetical protein
MGRRFLCDRGARPFAIVIVESRHEVERTAAELILESTGPP